MTPEEMQRKIEELEADMRSLRAAATIPFDVDQAFTARLGSRFSTVQTQSLKPGASELQSVNEAGSATYNVAKGMDGFLLYAKDGVSYYLPYYL